MKYWVTFQRFTSERTNERTNQHMTTLFIQVSESLLAGINRTSNRVAFPKFCGQYEGTLNLRRDISRRHFGITIHCGEGSGEYEL